MKKKYSVLLPLIVFVFLPGCSLQDEPSNFLEINKNTYVNNELNTLNNGSINSTDLEDKKNQFVHFDSNFKLWTDSEIPPGTHVNISINGTGTATHMGNTKLIIDEDISVDQVQNIWESSATVIATASNGDELHFSCICNIDVSETPDFIFTGYGEITGGTGRFENAEGNLEVNKRFNWYSLDGTVTFKGAVKY